jgi:hypothetical protein
LPPKSCCSQQASHCTALHCTALHNSALHCTKLHCTALHCTARQASPVCDPHWADATRCRPAAQHCTTLHNTAQHCSTLLNTAQHCTTLHSTAQHCTTLQQCLCSTSQSVSAANVESGRTVWCVWCVFKWTSSYTGLSMTEAAGSMVLTPGQARTGHVQIGHQG